MQNKFKDIYEEAKMEVIIFSGTDSFITTSKEGTQGEVGENRIER